MAMGERKIDEIHYFRQKINRIQNEIEQTMNNINETKINIRKIKQQYAEQRQRQQQQQLWAMKKNTHPTIVILYLAIILRANASKQYGKFSASTKWKFNASSAKLFAVFTVHFHRNCFSLFRGFSWFCKIPPMEIDVFFFGVLTRHWIYLWYLMAVMVYRENWRIRSIATFGFIWLICSIFQYYFRIISDGLAWKMFKLTWFSSEINVIIQSNFFRSLIVNII